MEKYNMFTAQKITYHFKIRII